MKCIGKSEYADQLGVSKSTLGRWLNSRYLSTLQKIGYDKKQRMLTPAQKRLLDEILCNADDAEC